MNRHPKNILYLGNYSECLEGILKDNIAIGVMSEKGKTNSKIVDFCRCNNILHAEVSCLEDVIKVFDKVGDVDLLLVGSCGIILPEKIINLPRFKTVNVHPGLLPNYRGRHPLPWAIRNGEKEAGISAHIMTKDVDQGAIIEQDHIIIDYSKGYKYNEKKLLELIPQLVARTLKKVFSGNMQLVPQKKGEGSYFPPMEEEILLNIINSERLSSVREGV